MDAEQNDDAWWSAFDTGPIRNLIERFDELRQRLMRIAIITTLLFACSFPAATNLMRLLKIPLERALGPQVQLHFTGPFDAFMIGVKVAFIAAVIVGAPYWIFQVFQFIKPALKPRLRKLIPTFILSSLILFLLGAVFCYFVMLPPALEFLIGLGTGVATPIITIVDYLSLVLFLLLAFGAAFQTPIILILLAMLGVIDASTLQKNRRMTFVVILVIAAIVTPTPDPVSQLAMAIPMYLLFEVAMLIIKRLRIGEETEQ